MMQQISILFDRLSEFFAHRKGLLPIVGLVLVLLNFVMQIVPGGWLASTNCFLHLGVLLAIVGFMLARAL